MNIKKLIIIVSPILMFLFIVSMSETIRPFFTGVFVTILILCVMVVFKNIKKIDYKYVVKWWLPIGLLSMIDVGLTAYIVDSGVSVSRETNLIVRFLFNSLGMNGFFITALINLFVIFIVISFVYIIDKKNRWCYFILSSMIFLAIIGNFYFYVLS